MSLKPYYDPILGETRAKDEGGGGSYVLPPATASELGGVKIGSGIDAQTDGTISVTPYSLPIAGSDALGGIKVGSGVDVATDGTMSLALPVAAADVLGAIKVGTGLSIDSATGVLSASGGDIPIASASTLGGIKVGNGLKINSTTGVLTNSGTVFNMTEYTNGSSISRTLNKGFYWILAVGAGGGGAAGNVIGNTYATGGGGAAGCAFLALIGINNDSTSCNIYLGAGGKGGKTTGNDNFYGGAGGDTYVEINQGQAGYSKTYIYAPGGYGGGAGASANDFLCRKGGNGNGGVPTGKYYTSLVFFRMPGGLGQCGVVSDQEVNYGASGGEPALSGCKYYLSNNIRGRGGDGGGTTSTGYASGQDGQDGAVWIFSAV